MELSLLNLLLVLLAAWLAGNFASRFGYPAVLGELLAGIVLGPPMLGLLEGSAAIAVLAEVGVLLMMLYIGMEVDPGDLKKVSWAGTLAAIGGFITPFVLAYFTVIWFGGTMMAGLFVGIAAGITSLATKSRILVDLKLLDTRIAHVMMAGALIADTLSLIIFAAILGMAEGESINFGELGLVGVRIVLFFGVTILIGQKFFPWAGKKLSEAGLTGRTFNFTLVLLIAVSFGELAELAGLHAILGAFIAGLFLRENVLGRTLARNLMSAVEDASIGFLAPIFFVTAGFQVSFSVFQTDLAFFVAIMAVATFGKIGGTALFYLATGYGWREGITIGAGMNGRGAVEIIVAGIALEMGLISADIFSILVFMAIFTTAAVPLMLKWGTDWLRGRGELVRRDEERRGVLIVGAGSLARLLAHRLAESQPVWLVDSNQRRVQQARSEGLRAFAGNALQENVLGEARAPEVRALVAMTTNVEINMLVAQLAKDVFQVPDIHILQSGQDGTGHTTSMKRLGATSIFASPIGMPTWDHHIEEGTITESVVTVRREDTSDPASFVERLREGGRCLPLVQRSDEKVLPLHDRSTFTEGDEVLLLCQKPTGAYVAVSSDRFDKLVDEALFLDIEEKLPMDAFFDLAARELGRATGIDAGTVKQLLINRENDTSSLIAPGLAVPHAVIEGAGRFAMVVARAREGIEFPREREAPRALFVLVRSRDERTFHLRTLAAIAQVVQDPEFESNWETAENVEELRRIVREAERRRYTENVRLSAV